MQIKDFLFCDDIRAEIGNKHSLMGVYGDELNFASQPGKPVKWPMNKPLGLFIKLIIDDSDIFDSIKMKFSMDNYDTRLPEVNMPIDASKITKRQINLVTKMEPLHIPGPGKLVVYLSFLKQGNILETICDISLDINER
ncbi:MAG: hypothetical protein JEY99_01085 [Spirochaetales bacterium]|nr:hypothetical protein [Spirochaetales bacterium]